MATDVCWVEIENAGEVNAMNWIPHLSDDNPGPELRCLVPPFCKQLPIARCCGINPGELTEEAGGLAPWPDDGENVAKDLPGFRRAEPETGCGVQREMSTITRPTNQHQGPRPNAGSPSH